MMPVSRVDKFKGGSSRSRDLYGWLLVAVCGLASLTDGFDTQAIAYAAPTMSSQLGIAPSWLGSIFGAGLFGGLFGALPAPYLERHIGRKLTLIICLLWFSVTSAATSVANSIEYLMALRFLAGLGLGTAIPLLFAIATDAVPQTKRARALSVVIFGIPAGGFVAGIVGAAVIPVFGWRSIFWIGTVLPLVVLFLYLILPQSAAGEQERAKEEFASARATKKESNPFASLFRNGRAFGTIIILLTTSLSVCLAYTLSNWTPMLLHQIGMTQTDAAIAGSVMNGGAAIAILLFGFALDRLDAVKVIASCYVLGGILLITLGTPSISHQLLLAIILGVGVCAIGTQFGVTHIMSSRVGPEDRVAALSAGLVFSRIGAVIGPVVAGLLLQEGHSPAFVFAFIAGIAFAAACGVALMGRRRQPTPQTT